MQTLWPSPAGRNAPRNAGACCPAAASPASVLQRVLNGRIVFAPFEKDPAVGFEMPGYSFKAQTRYDKLFTGGAVPRPAEPPTAVPSWNTSGPRYARCGLWPCALTSLRKALRPRRDSCPKSMPKA